jgi:LmbE family N-acetylglucosaminyl deacetylase
MDSTNPYSHYIKNIAQIFHDGLSLPLGGIPRPKAVKIVPSAPKVLILAPHPDDECVMGPLPLRLMREAGSRVINLPITFGSNPERKEERKVELEAACQWIGFELETMECGGLENLNPESKEKDPKYWEKAVSELAQTIKRIKPDMLFFPNATDWNRTHLGVHIITKKALSELNAFSTTLVETEFWGQMNNPNLLVESSTEEVADLVAALSHHKGEVQRNPFHLRLPAWMQDNVRRGAEVVGGQGGMAPKFDFGTLYKISRWENGKQYQIWKKGKILGHALKNESEILSHLP